jgi:hypothetical protein
VIVPSAVICNFSPARKSIFVSVHSACPLTSTAYVFNLEAPLPPPVPDVVCVFAPGAEGCAGWGPACAHVKLAIQVAPTKIKIAAVRTIRFILLVLIGIACFVHTQFFVSSEAATIV